MTKTRIRALLWSMLLLLTLAGVASVDYGTHADELRLVFAVHDAVETGRALPGWYNYPSFSFDVALTVAAPEVFAVLAADDESAARDATSSIAGEPYRLRLRRAFFALSLLAPAGVALLLTALGFDRSWALVGALVLLASPEFFTHARWIAPDALLAAAVILCLWCQSRLLAADSDHSKKWLLASACAAGVCIGIKYTGGIVVLPLCITLFLAAFRRERDRAGASLRLGLDLALSALCVAAAFVVTTPGFVLEPSLFWSGVQEEVTHYRTGHWGYSVGAGIDHFRKISTYLGLQGLSRSVPVAAVFSGLGLIGFLALLRRDRGLGLWALSLPISYVLYMSTQSVMFARNYVLLLPLFAAAAVIGLRELARTLPVGIRRIVYAAFGALIAVNAWAVLQDARRILRPVPVPPPLQMVEAIDDLADGRGVWLSPALQTYLDAERARLEAPIRRRLRSPGLMVFWTGEIAEPGRVPANELGRYRTLWAPHREVNWDYYPTWLGPGRILAVSGDDADVKYALRELSSHEVGAD